MYLVQTFEIVWLVVVIELISSNCNMPRLIDNRHFFSVSSLVNMHDITANRHVGKFKKNVTVQYFYPHALNMEYFYLNLSLKGVF